MSSIDDTMHLVVSGGLLSSSTMSAAALVIGRWLGAFYVQDTCQLAVLTGTMFNYEISFKFLCVRASAYL